MRDIDIDELMMVIVLTLVVLTAIVSMAWNGGY
jgi:hypothetical protein